MQQCSSPEGGQRSRQGVIVLITPVRRIFADCRMQENTEK